MGLFLGLMAATLASEDATLLASGLLVQQGGASLAFAIAACTLGIVVGDVALWAAGRWLGRTVPRLPWLSRHADPAASTAATLLLAGHAGRAILASRFLPGTRLPLYLAAGAAGVPLFRFTAWVLLAAVLWTPPLVVMAACVGDAFVAPVSSALGAAPALVLFAACTWLVLRLARRSATEAWRRRVAARLARWSRWEFWPMWLFYAPVAIWVAWLALRHRGLSTLTAANPGIPDGGTVGESKFAILARLPAESTVPAVLVSAGAPSERVARLMADVADRGWAFPLVLKPDVGQRGTGVRLIRTVDEARVYLARDAGPVVAQPYHPGPFEAGVFYYRFPHEERGRVLSITDKCFPVVVGDGRSTLEALIWAHPRYRMQADLFLARHRDARTRVLAAGERFSLAMAGNHAQGTMFRDGRRLLTPALERRIDEIARSYDGFYVGRFDIRYGDLDAFMAGRDLAIVELNGATAESTNIYDPDASLWSAYRQLFHQWSLVFAIGAANRARGAVVTPLARLLGLVRRHMRATPGFAISD
jgi:membrane protein DedA with SNARE-associated domain